MNHRGETENSRVISIQSSGNTIVDSCKGCCWYIRKRPEVMKHISYFSIRSGENELTVIQDWIEMMRDIGMPGNFFVGAEGTAKIRSFVNEANSNGHHISMPTLDCPNGYGVMEFTEEHSSEAWLGDSNREGYHKLMAHTFFRYLWCRGRAIADTYSRLKQSDTAQRSSKWDMLRLSVIIHSDLQDPNYGAINKIPLSWDSVEQFRTTMSSNISSIQSSFSQGSSYSDMIKLSSFEFAKDTPVNLLKMKISNNQSVDNDLIIDACDQMDRINGAISSANEAIVGINADDDFDYDIKVYNDKLVGVWVEMTGEFNDIFIVIAKY